ncbi:Uncharacterized protein OBRU01_13924 [Operophtera brumata]|uniref:6-phosphofructo-2-kinase domain-containing protein n=1 Tax=Operophtera brumata TaxID=104452 RepID=A0A0L7L7G1_OPEBR|nr:Uncharacterized protein OBRU01_13924 [Operophtera brumata]
MDADDNRAEGWKYLNKQFFGDVFNLGEYRRHATTAYTSHEFFRADNKEAMAIRQQCALDALQDVCEWLVKGGEVAQQCALDALQDVCEWLVKGGEVAVTGKEALLIRQQCALDALQDVCEWLVKGGEVAVFDATNSTLDRRRMIRDIVVHKMGFKLFFVESICDDPRIIEQNIMEVKVSSPDYTNIQNTDNVLNDFLLRIEHYKDKYEPLDQALESEWWCTNTKDTSRAASFVSTVCCPQHGESMYNVEGRIGGDSALSARGRTYAAALSGYIEQQGRIGGDSALFARGRTYAAALSGYIEQQSIPGLRVWTSWMRRAIQTVKDVKAPQERWKALNEIDATVKDVKAPQERWKALNEIDADLVARLEPVIMELERQGNVLVVSHQALPYLHVPLHTVIKLTPVAYGCREEHIKLSVGAVDTHRPKPSVNLPQRDDNGAQSLNVHYGPTWSLGRSVIIDAKRPLRAYMVIGPQCNNRR